MRLEILLTAVLFFGGTCLAGYGLRHVLKLKREGVLFSVLSGAMVWWAVLELILVPMTMALCSFTSLVYVYSTLILLLALAGCLGWREIWEDVRELPGKLHSCLTLGHLIAFALICYQLHFVHHHMYLEWDDTYYVNLANEAVNSDKIYWVYPETGTLADFDKRYVLSLWPIFYAWLSKLAGVIPTIMAHTILPWLIIPLAYMVYALIGRRLFQEDHQLRGMFLTFAVLLHLFMTGEHTSGLTFLSITPWVGKGVLAAVLIPTLFYMILRIAQRDSFADWFLLGVTCLGGCLLSSMGIMLTPVFVGTAVCLMAWYKKQPVCLLKGIGACAPCLLLGIYYIYLTH